MTPEELAKRALLGAFLSTPQHIADSYVRRVAAAIRAAVGGSVKPGLICIHSPKPKRGSRALRGLCAACQMAVENQMLASVLIEREVCARIADRHAKTCPHKKPYDGCCEAVADEIRARGKA